MGHNHIMMNLSKYKLSCVIDITEIDLHMKNIIKMCNLDKYHKLLKLNISYNRLKRLPLLPNLLEELRCSSNELTEILLLPELLKIFNCSNNKLVGLINLSTFYNLETLNCANNQIIKLPLLPDTLKELNCSNNNLTELCDLSAFYKLNVLNCSNNQLINLPALSSTLEIINCSHNQLINIPTLPNIIDMLICSHNQLQNLPIIPNTILNFAYNYNPIYDIINSDNINTINTRLSIIRKFKFLYFILKYKKRFINFYYKKVVEPRVIIRSHPSNLIKIINNNPNNDIIEIINYFEQLIDIV